MLKLEPGAAKSAEKQISPDNALFQQQWFSTYKMQFAQFVSDTTLDDLTAIIQGGLGSGASGDEIRRQMQAAFAKWSSNLDPSDPDFEWLMGRSPTYRAELIARDQTLRASNATTFNQFQEWGLKLQEWFTTLDGRERLLHRMMHGRIVPVGEPFIFADGTRVLFPGDSSLGAPLANIIQCRCTVLPVLGQVPETSYEQQTFDIARFQMELAQRFENQVTSMMLDLERQTAGRLESLAFRLKSPESLARKIQTEALRQNIPLEQAANEITDRVRYTMTFEADELVAKTADMFGGFEEQGYVLDVAHSTNYFGSGGAYEGLNTVWRNGAGDVFEFQVHTPVSLRIKQVNHLLYELWRVTTDPVEKGKLWNSMIASWDVPEYLRPAGFELLLGGG